MDIKEELIYTLKEASNLTGLHPRKLNRIAVKHNIKKIDNRYLFDGLFLINYLKTMDLTASNFVKGLSNVSKDLYAEKSFKDKLFLKEDLISKDNEIKLLQQEIEYLKNHKQTSIEVQALESEIIDLKKELEQVKSLNQNSDIDLNKAIDIITLEASRQNVLHKIFTNEEFEDIIGTFALSESQENQINYLRNRIEKQDQMLINLAKQIEQRNYIEAVKETNNKE